MAPSSTRRRSLRLRAPSLVQADAAIPWILAGLCLATVVVYVVYWLAG